MKLWIKDGDWQIITTSWTAASKNNHSTEIAYLWGADQISVFSGATGVARLTLDVPFDLFSRDLNAAHEKQFDCLDCRRWCK